MSQRSLAVKKIEDEIHDEMLIKGVKIDTVIKMMWQVDLKYYAENPRVYSIVREEGREPAQEEIEGKLQEMDHVKILVQDIKKHGGLIDPLVVKADTLEVVEGNSRLAAYRILVKTNPVKWGLVKCRLLPATVDEALLASLLGQWHLKGKREWPPYEQAGFLYRRHTHQNTSVTSLSIEVGLPVSRIKKIIEAYELMTKFEDSTRERWSYYDEFVKSRKIAKVREKHPKIDELVISKVQSGEIKRAQDLRDHLPVICSSSPKVLQKFLSGKLDFEEAHEAARDSGGDHTLLVRLKRFRQWIAQQDIQDSLNSSEGKVRQQVEFEIKQVQKVVASMVRRMGQPD